jgi:hypothetical protein
MRAHVNVAPKPVTPEDTVTLTLTRSEAYHLRGIAGSNFTVATALKGKGDPAGGPDTGTFLGEVFRTLDDTLEAQYGYKG